MVMNEYKIESKVCKNWLFTGWIKVTDCLIFSSQVFIHLQGRRQRIRATVNIFGPPPPAKADRLKIFTLNCNAYSVSE